MAVSRTVVGLLVLCFLGVTGHAQTNTWNGSVDTDWHKGCNWSLNQVPTCAHNVHIPNVANDPVITGIAHCSTIDVETTLGANLVINTTGGGKLEVNTCPTTMTVNATSSTAPTGASASVSVTCGGSSTLSVIGGSLGVGASWNWYTGGCGGTLIGTGSSLPVTPSVTTTYYVRAVGPCNTTSCASVTVTVNSVPAMPGSITMSGFWCSDSGNLSISAVSGATGYTWIAGVGVTINSGQGTTSINATITDSGIVVDCLCGSPQPNYYSVCVVAVNSCGASSQRCGSIEVDSCE